MIVPLTSTYALMQHKFINSVMILRIETSFIVIITYKDFFIKVRGKKWVYYIELLCTFAKQP
jgi:hypothetical protein